MSNAEGFRIDLAPAFRDDIRILMLRAIRKGQLADLISALQELERQLVTDPVGWGDPLNNYPHLGLVAFRRLQGPLIFKYAVDRLHKIVYVRRALPLPGRGLESVP